MSASTPTVSPSNAPSERDDARARALRVLKMLGWQELPATQAFSLREGRTREVLLRPILEERLRALNSFQYGGEVRAFGKEAIEAACKSLEQSVDQQLLQANETIWSRLRLGTHAAQTIEGDTKSFALRYLDWDDPQNNAFHVVQGFEVAGESASRFLDLVLFVNGIPLAIIECSAGLDARDPQVLASAMGELQSDQRPRNIPRLFHYAQLLFAVSRHDAAYGVVGAEPHRWGRWREQHAAPTTLRSALASARGPATTKAGRSPAQADHSDLLLAANEQDRLIHALCRPARLLELVGWFTVFGAGERNVPRYDQYFAVQAVLARVGGAQEAGRWPGGVVAQPLGTDTALTMDLAAAVILDALRERTPRVILVTDRAEMDEEGHDTLLARGIDCRLARTGRHLLELLRDSQTSVIACRMQKFAAVIHTKMHVSSSPDIFVLVDDAHRVPPEAIHSAMHRMLPRACFIGFTDSPQPEAEATLEAFGSRIATYTLEQAMLDHVLLPVHQELRSGGDFESAESLRALAADVAAHFTGHFSGSGLKGQIVVPSRGAALRLQHYFDESRSLSTAVLISLADLDSTEASPVSEGRSPADGIHEFRRQILQKFASEARYERDVLHRFKVTAAPQLLIVVDKRLRGFAVPGNSVLYLARALQGMALAEAIAGIRLPHVAKNRGRLVNYAGEHLPSTWELGIVTVTGEQENRPPDLTEEAVPRSLEQREPVIPEALELAIQRVLGEELENARLTLASEITHALGVRIAAILWRRRKVDWALNPDIQNRMKTALEEELYRTQSEAGIALGLSVIDAMLERCVGSARTLVP